MNSHPSPKEDEVAAANRRFYDQIADCYDDIDSRRKGAIKHEWIGTVFDQMRSLLANTKAKDNPAFMDAGSGSGFLAVRAYEYFKNITMVDISQKMLDRIDLPGATKICSDLNSIPVEDASYDIIGAFATLHHLKSPKIFFAEAFRVLRTGGVLYTDHDIEQTFVRNFRPLLVLYRSRFDHGKKYLDSCPSASESDYFLSEYHGDKGLSGSELTADLRAAGFEVVEMAYHWEGMGPIASILDKLGLKRLFTRRGLAPVVRILAVKRQQSYPPFQARTAPSWPG